MSVNWLSAHCPSVDGNLQDIRTQQFSLFVHIDIPLFFWSSRLTLPLLFAVSPLFSAKWTSNVELPLTLWKFLCKHCDCTDHISGSLIYRTLMWCPWLTYIAFLHLFVEQLIGCVIYTIILCIDKEILKFRPCNRPRMCKSMRIWKHFQCMRININLFVIDFGYYLYAVLLKALYHNFHPIYIVLWINSYGVL